MASGQKQAIKLQTAVSKTVDDKLTAYGKFMGLSKNNYVRHLLIRGMALDEKESIPEDLKNRFVDLGQLNMFDKN